jgi:hypothetical protein
MRMMNTMIRTYSELIQIPTFEERFEYLKLNGQVGELTFNGHRYLNQKLYRCTEWRSFRRKIIIRDNGCDLACDGYFIVDDILIHHINPITIGDVVERRPCVFDPENVICTSLNTHNAVHYGDKDLLPTGPIVRTKNDTCPWR